MPPAAQPPPRLMAIREGSESRASSRATTPLSRAQLKPTPLDGFLEAMDEKFLVYAERLVG